MLSYRHGFHAGNFADVLKHITLTKVVDYLLKKPSPIMYIDTHSGAGSYRLDSEMANKTGEYTSGVMQLDFAQLPEAQSYARLVSESLLDQRYPGSPDLAARLLRPVDKLRLFELHSTEYPHLKQHFADDARCLVNHSDGHASIKACLLYTSDAADE